MGSFPETYNGPECLGKCYTPDVILLDCDSEKTGFLTRANAARFQGQPAQVIGPLGYVCTTTDEFLTSLKFICLNLIFYR